MTHARELDWLQHSVGVLALNDRAIISVNGDDAQDWLQGQVTNQVEGLGPGDSVYAFVLTLKGRVLGDVWVLLREDEIWLDVPAAQVEALLERFDRYIIMEDVDLEHRADLRVLLAQGPFADQLSNEGWPSNRVGTGGREWVVSEAELGAELELARSRSLELGGGWISDQAWAHAQVVLGSPCFGVDFGESTYPQETGLGAQALSFNKGCYIGQETVVMLENRGKAPKVLWRWSLDGSEAPAPETAIEKDGATVGELTSAVEHDGGVLALGFLKRGHETDAAEGFEIRGQAARALGAVATGPRFAAKQG